MFCVFLIYVRKLGFPLQFIWTSTKREKSASEPPDVMRWRWYKLILRQAYFKKSNAVLFLYGPKWKHSVCFAAVCLGSLNGTAECVVGNTGVSPHLDQTQKHPSNELFLHFVGTILVWCFLRKFWMVFWDFLNLMYMVSKCFIIYGLKMCYCLVWLDEYVIFSSCWEFSAYT